MKNIKKIIAYSLLNVFFLGLFLFSSCKKKKESNEEDSVKESIDQAVDNIKDEVSHVETSIDNIKENLNRSIASINEYKDKINTLLNNKDARKKAEEYRSLSVELAEKKLNMGDDDSLKEKEVQDIKAKLSSLGEELDSLYSKIPPEEAAKLKELIKTFSDLNK